MRSTALTVCLLLALWSAGNLPSEASAQSLLHGATASSHTVPQGWTKVLSEGFENGKPAFPQYISNITTDRAHTGTHSDGGTVAGDSQSVKWGIEIDQVFAPRIYISVWEYLTPNFRMNDEMFLFHFRKEDPNYVQHIVFDWYYNSPGTFNSTNGRLVMVTEGSGPNYTNEPYYTSDTTIPVGAWHQWEIDYRPNTPGQSNGNMTIYLDGVIFKQWLNQNLVKVDMQGARLQVGGTYTKHVWYRPPDPPLSCGSFIGDGTSDNNHRCTDFTNCSCSAQNVPVFQRYFDDIIVMRQGGSGGITGVDIPAGPPLPPTGLTFN